jgi:hypothetical protein
MSLRLPVGSRRRAICSADRVHAGATATTRGRDCTPPDKVAPAALIRVVLFSNRELAFTLA